MDVWREATGGGTSDAEVAARLAKLAAAQRELKLGVVATETPLQPVATIREITTEVTEVPNA